MEITGEDGTLVRLPLSSIKLIGRGTGISTTDTTIAKHQLSLKATAGFTENDDAPPPDKWWEAPPSRNGLGKGAKQNRVRLEVLGPNPICVLRQGVDGDHVSAKEPGKSKVEFLGQGEGCWLVPGDKLSLSIVKPVFYTVGGSEKRELAGKALGGELKQCVEVQREGQKVGALEERKRARLENESGNKKVGVDRDEDEAEPVKQHGGIDKSQTDRKSLREERNVETQAEKAGNKRGRDAENENGGKFSKRRREAERGGGSEEPIREEETAGQSAGVNTSRKDRSATGPSDEGFDPIKEYGLIVEGAEFDQYDQKRAHNTRPWSWQIGPSKQQDDSDDEPPSEEDKPRSGRPSAPGGSQARAKPPPQKRGKSKKGESDEDEWTGDSESEAEEVTDVGKGLRGSGKAPAVTTRSHDGSRGRKGRGSEEGGSVPRSRGKAVSASGTEQRKNGTERMGMEERKSGTERKATEERNSGTELKPTEQRKSGTELKPTEERKSGTERNSTDERKSGTERTATEERKSETERNPTEPGKSGTGRKSAGAKAKGSQKKKGRGGSEDESDEDESGDDEPTEEDLDFIVDDEAEIEEDASEDSDSEEDWEDDDDEKAPKQPRGKQAVKDTRPMCRYGSKCYRKNPDHLKQFRHPSR